MLLEGFSAIVFRHHAHAAGARCSINHSDVTATASVLDFNSSWLNHRADENCRYRAAIRSRKIACALQVHSILRAEDIRRIANEMHASGSSLQTGGSN
jgi:hypothetical protein